MNRLLQAALLIVTLTGVSACYGPTPPPPGPHGRSLDVPPRYGAPDSQTSYLEGTNTADPNAANVQPPNPNAPAANGPVTPPPTAPGGTTAPPPVTVTPPGNTTPSTPPTTPAAPAEIPFATRIPGKPGFVKSPFDPNGQAIDVRDFQSGQKARCPYTGKVFRVP
ncbi:MAG: hypothetical protein U1F71_05000 [Verrucomicrobiaceae bacterium]